MLAAEGKAEGRGAMGDTELSNSGLEIGHCVA